MAVRFAVNNATSSVYYLSEKTSDYESRLKSLGESGYAEYVKTNGTQFSTSVATGPTGDSIYETTLTSLYGDYTIVGVAFVDNKNVIGAMGWGGRTKATTLQISSVDSNKYRFKDLYGKNAHLYFTLNGKEGKDDDGNFRNFSMPAHATSGEFGNYGTMMIRDVATWQGDAGILCSGRTHSLWL